MHTATFGIYLFQEGKHVKCQAVFFEFLVAKSRWKEKSCISFRQLCLFVPLC